MRFTYNSYKNLIDLLKDNNYTSCTYKNYINYNKCVILRHDIDQSLEKALALAEFEYSLGVCSTYFVLLKTDFYNVASKTSQDIIQKIHNMGHEIGLHFDEVAYGEDIQNTSELIKKEADILSKICDLPIKTVSMHRPSKKTLESDLEIEGMINSYGSVFFNDFKYLSDSRRNWREPVLDIIKSNQYNRLHILTHAFWYNDDEKSIEESIKKYINSANIERYSYMQDNIRDLESIMKESEVL